METSASFDARSAPSPYPTSMSMTGLGCLSTPMGDTELEGLIETVAAVLEMERGR